MKFTAYNGSPRGNNSNSQTFMDLLCDHFGGSVEITKHCLNKIEIQDELFTPQADAYFFVFPLYTDTTPYPVKLFFEKMEEHKDMFVNKPIYFFVHSGFPEGKHSRILEKYLKYFCSIIGARCMGVAIMGNSEGIRYQSDDSKRRIKINENMKGFANNIANGNPFNTDGIDFFNRMEVLPKFAVFILKTFPNLFNKMFDSMIKRHGAYDKRFDKPYV